MLLLNYFEICYLRTKGSLLKLLLILSTALYYSLCWAKLHPFTSMHQYVVSVCEAVKQSLIS